MRNTRCFFLCRQTSEVFKTSEVFTSWALNVFEFKVVINRRAAGGDIEINWQGSGAGCLERHVNIVPQLTVVVIDVDAGHLHAVLQVIEQAADQVRASAAAELKRGSDNGAVVASEIALDIVQAN